MRYGRNGAVLSDLLLCALVLQLSAQRSQIRKDLVELGRFKGAGGVGDEPGKFIWAEPTALNLRTV